MGANRLYNAWEYSMGKLEQLGCIKTLTRHPNIRAFFFRLTNVQTIEGISVKNDFEKYWFKLVVDEQWGPKIYIWGPKIGKLHHVWSDDRLCLYDPKEMDWQLQDEIIEKTIGWTYLWIVYFEEWQKTEIWPGPEVKHEKLVSKT